MYLSHPVRRMRDDPIDGEEVTLVVELDGGADRDAFESTVREAGGTVERDLQFRAVLVRVPESAVTSLCELDDLARIETGETLSLGVDEDATLPSDDAGDESGFDDRLEPGDERR
ncbi:hypothetical protein [Haloprofundus halophilus]|uniref:hypothetical protein n=1 Tax=Haloprofundus halophilus TaxID=2283527 RepID=UPI000E44D8A1|nr:hypothetical protein [Haloprofundus halophilus]